MASISNCINFYLVNSFLFFAEIRELENYPIFLLSLIDFLATGLGYMFEFISHEFIAFHSSTAWVNFESHGFQFYNEMRFQLRMFVKRHITVSKINPFWFYCLPHLMLFRLNEYGHGLCSLLVAYERFVLVCKPTEKWSLLSRQKRKISYTIVTIFILAAVSAEIIYHYFERHLNCVTLLVNFEKPFLGSVFSLVSNFIFSFMPALFCSYCYFSTAKVLLKRRRKIGRNLNLVLCFTAICAVWMVTFSISACLNVYHIIVLLLISSFTEIYKYPLFKNAEHFQMFYMLVGVTSIFNPFLILISNKDYRQPFFKFRDKFKLFFRLD